ncbi:MAG: homoserine O-acetyltransferase [Verrucomicrobia bacterium]|nr:homoserine O-acetyltransferase [Kiritimatiellia bacterium]MCB1101006.1 homoserine O-acetyltransferase [Kiritimatiellia bacterium]MCP5487087.1 homoserine O-acetyltransferase [Verrucomicrobiota bacterium]
MTATSSSSALPQGQHPEGVGETRTRWFTFGDQADPFVFRTGETLSSVTLAYEQYGELNEKRDNAILLFHALSGSQHAAGYNPAIEGVGNLWTEEMHTGWWDAFIGPGRALDTNRYCILCVNYIGGCYGSSGPVSIHPDTGKPFGREFPTVMIGDIVDSQMRLLDHLGIQTLHAVVGGSLGGLCAVNLAVQYPDRVQTVIPIASGAAVSILQRITNYEQICAIEEDKHFNGGHYYEGPRPDRGLALARMISHKTFVSLEMLELRARQEVIRPEEDKDKWYWLSHPVESYLRNQGLKFVKRFDANTYLRIMDAWQRFDLLKETGKATLAEVFDACRDQRYLIFSIDSDVCFHPELQDEQCHALRKAGVTFHHITVHSEKGHDSFLLEPDLFVPHLDYALNKG